MEENNNITYTVLVENREDGVGQNWSYEEALAHVARCEFDDHNIEYTIKEIDETELQPTKPKSKPRRARKNSTNSGK